MTLPETRASLIVELQGERNELAWTEFVAAYEPFLRTLVEQQGVPSRHVADVSQQILLACAKSVERIHDDGREASFRRWLQQVARHVVIRFMTTERRQVVARGGSELLALLEQTPAETSAEQLRQYDYELVVWAAQQVRHEFRETSWHAFWATQIEEREVTAVAAELNVSPGAIYMSRSRILARIRAKVAELMEE